jgi:hypothetical protein
LHITRQLIEKFFHDIKYLYKSNKELQAIVKNENTAKLLELFAKQNTPFTAVNQLCLNPESKTFIWNYFSFPGTVLMPLLPETLIYGVLSDFLHADQLNKVIISNLSNNEFKQFISCLSSYYKKSIIEFDEMQAELGDDTI